MSSEKELAVYPDEVQILEQLEGYNPAVVCNDGPASYARDRASLKRWLAARDARLLAEALKPFRDLVQVVQDGYKAREHGDVLHWRFYNAVRMLLEAAVTDEPTEGAENG